VLVIGATTAFFMGLLGVVNNDIKRVIAYSTLSQLGYMTVALGVFRLWRGHLPPDEPTHSSRRCCSWPPARSSSPCTTSRTWRRMGGLAKYMPITAVTCWIGAPGR